jgi:hypothetical protein
LYKKFENTKMVMTSHKSKDRQYNGEMKKDKKTSSGRQNSTRKTKDWLTQRLKWVLNKKAGK